MSKKAEIKKSLLEQLAAMMMSEDGKRLGPKKEDVLVVVEPVADENAEEQDELEDVLEDAEKDAMLEHLAAEEVAEEEDDENNPKRRKTLKEFLASC